MGEPGATHEAGFHEASLEGPPCAGRMGDRTSGAGERGRPTKRPIGPEAGRRPAGGPRISRGTARFGLGWLPIKVESGHWKERIAVA